MGGAGQLRLPLEVEQGRLARLLDGRGLGRRGVHGDPQAHITLAWMPRLAPRRPVRLEVPRQLGDAHAAKADEDRQAERGDARKRLGSGGGHPDRRVRRPVRARGDRGVVEAIVLAGVTEGLALPGLENDLQRLEETLLTLRIRDAERVVRARRATAADAEIESSVAEVIERGDLTGDAQRMVERQQLHGRAHAQAPGLGRDGGGHQERRREHRARRVDQHLGQPQNIQAPRFALFRELVDLLEPVLLAAALAQLLGKYPEIHGVPLARPPSAALGASARILKPVPGPRQAAPPRPSLGYAPGRPS